MGGFCFFIALPKVRAVTECILLAPKKNRAQWTRLIVNFEF